MVRLLVADVFREERRVDGVERSLMSDKKLEHVNLVIIIEVGIFDLLMHILVQSYEGGLNRRQHIVIDILAHHRIIGRNKVPQLHLLAQLVDPVCLDLLPVQLFLSQSAFEYQQSRLVDSIDQDFLKLLFLVEREGDLATLLRCLLLHLLRLHLKLLNDIHVMGLDALDIVLNLSPNVTLTDLHFEDVLHESLKLLIVGERAVNRVFVLHGQLLPTLCNHYAISWDFAFLRVNLVARIIYLTVICGVTAIKALHPKHLQFKCLDFVVFSYCCGFQAFVLPSKREEKTLLCAALNFGLLKTLIHEDLVLVFCDFRLARIIQFQLSLAQPLKKCIAISFNFPYELVQVLNDHILAICVNVLVFQALYNDT